MIGVALAINGAAGHKYGIPFMVQARSAFGFAGTRLPAQVRSVPADAHITCRSAFSKQLIAVVEDSDCRCGDVNRPCNLQCVILRDQ